jgi:1,4-dihydroxy-2-naphthoate octaprenyltransferase
MARVSPLSRRELWVSLLLYPTHTLPTAAAPVLVGIGLAVHDHVFAVLPVLVGFLASWLLHVGGVFIDNYVLLVRHPENREHPELIEALEKGTLSLPVLRGAIAFCFVAAMLTGPYLLSVGGFLVVVFGIFGIASSCLCERATRLCAAWTCRSDLLHHVRHRRGRRNLLVCTEN